MCAKEGENEDDVHSGSLLLQSAKGYVPVDKCSEALTVLDKFSNEEQHQVIGHEVAMLNGTLVLLGMKDLSSI